MKSIYNSRTGNPETMADFLYEAMWRRLYAKLKPTDIESFVLSTWLYIHNMKE